MLRGLGSWSLRDGWALVLVGLRRTDSCCWPAPGGELSGGPCSTCIHPPHTHTHIVDAHTAQILESMGLQAKERFMVYADRMPTQLLAFLRLSRLSDPALFAKVGVAALVPRQPRAHGLWNGTKAWFDSSPPVQSSRGRMLVCVRACVRACADLVPGGR